MKGMVWFRRDLRLRDNPALSAACQECQDIVPLFVFDEPLLRSHAFGRKFFLNWNSEHWLNRSLEMIP